MLGSAEVYGRSYPGEVREQSPCEALPPTTAGPSLRSWEGNEITLTSSPRSLAVKVKQ